METIDLLWRYKFGGLDPIHMEKWALGQLSAGNESQAVLELACDPGMHWQDRERCLGQVIDEMSLHELIENDTALRLAQEVFCIGQYLAGELNAVALIHIGETLFDHSDDRKSFSFWFELGEDFSLISRGEHPLFGHLSAEDIEGSLRKALMKKGKIHE